MDEYSGWEIFDIMSSCVALRVNFSTANKGWCLNVWVKDMCAVVDSEVF